MVYYVLISCQRVNEGLKEKIKGKEKATAHFLFLLCIQSVNQILFLEFSFLEPR